MHLSTIGYPILSTFFYGPHTAGKYRVYLRIVASFYRKKDIIVIRPAA